MATLMKFAAVVIFPFALNSSVPLERPQLRRNLVCVCVCLRRVLLQLSMSGPTGLRDNESLDRRSGSGAVGTIHLNQRLLGSEGEGEKFKRVR